MIFNPVNVYVHTYVVSDFMYNTVQKGFHLASLQTFAVHEHKTDIYDAFYSSFMSKIANRIAIQFINSQSN